MPDFKLIDEYGNFCSDFSSELGAIKDEVSRDILNYQEKQHLGSLEIEVLAKNLGVPNNVINEYSKILKDFYGANKFPNKPMDSNLKKQLGFNVRELTLKFIDFTSFHHKLLKTGGSSLRNE